MLNMFSYRPDLLFLLRLRLGMNIDRHCFCRKFIDWLAYLRVGPLTVDRGQRRREPFQRHAFSAWGMNCRILLQIDTCINLLGVKWPLVTRRSIFLVLLIIRLVLRGLPRRVEEILYVAKNAVQRIVGLLFFLRSHETRAQFWELWPGVPPRVSMQFDIFSASIVGPSTKWQ